MALVIFNVTDPPAKTYHRSTLSASDPRRPKLSNALNLCFTAVPSRRSTLSASDSPPIGSDPPLCFTSAANIPLFEKRFSAGHSGGLRG
ncbi:hypothetical protein CMV_027034 [Castanea mollissima]|uniref:Uncharacterized protein n=1 Tax=Castanea mollissima TaxID=60419 RepID=A0A8J4QAC2_9ROSI|nr:hypothetical protein CMV_027034 [Castanea mollissima]